LSLPRILIRAVSRVACQFLLSSPGYRYCCSHFERGLRCLLVPRFGTERFQLSLFATPGWTSRTGKASSVVVDSFFLFPPQVENLQEKLICSSLSNCAGYSSFPDWHRRKPRCASKFPFLIFCNRPDERHPTLSIEAMVLSWLTVGSLDPFFFFFLSLRVCKVQTLTLSWHSLDS